MKHVFQKLETLANKLFNILDAFYIKVVRRECTSQLQHYNH